MTDIRRKNLIAALLCLVTALVYARTAWHPFCANDDQEYVAQNLHVLSGLSLDSVRWAFSSFYAANWHPLTWLSLMLDAQLFGSNPAGYHLVNLAFHLVNSALLFYLLDFMTGALWRSALVAALFALHPLHVESVVWITERKDVLSTLFWLATVFWFAAYRRKGARGYYLLALAAFLLGLLAKPMLVTLPVVLLCLEIWPLGRSAAPAGSGWVARLRAIWTRRVILEQIPFLALSAGLSLVTLLAQRQTVAAITELPLSLRGANALWSTLLYAVKTVVPVQLAPFYPFLPVPLWQAACAAILLAGALYLALRNWQRSPYLLVGLLWYLVTLLPVIGLIQVGAQAMADRYSYIPQIGLFIILSWGACDIASRFPGQRTAVAALAAAFVTVCAALTFVQAGYWKDDITLYEHSLAVTTDNAFAHNMLGITYANRGQGAQALREYQESLRINPDDAGAHRNLGLVLDKQLGRSAEAVQQYRMAESLEPNNPYLHYHMAKAFMNMGKPAEAVVQYRKALELSPQDPYFHNDLGMALVLLGHNDEAIQQISEALRIMPNLGQAAANLQFARSRQGR